MRWAAPIDCHPLSTDIKSCLHLRGEGDDWEGEEITAGGYKGLWRVPWLIVALSYPGDQPGVSDLGSRCLTRPDKRVIMRRLQDDIPFFIPSNFTEFRSSRMIAMCLTLAALPPVSLRCSHRNCEDTEVNLVFTGPQYKDLPQLYIPEKYYKNPSQFRFSILFASNSRTLIQNVAFFLFSL